MAREHRRNAEREQLWQQTVAAWQQSGLTIRAFCAGRGSREPSFYFWRRALRDRDQRVPVASESAAQLAAVQSAPAQSDPPQAAAQLPPRQSARKRPLRLVPVRVVPEPVVEVVLPTGVVVRVPVGVRTGTDIAAVAQLVAGLVAALLTGRGAASW
jgi:hypothetical protein